MRRRGDWLMLASGTAVPLLSCVTTSMFVLVMVMGAAPSSVLTRFAGGEFGGDLTAVLLFSVVMFRGGVGGGEKEGCSI